MSETCTHDCSTCSSNCSEQQPESLIKPTHELSEIKKVIGVVSGKGGVGKSSITAMLAVLAQRAGYKTAIMDADITGPSIPKMLKVDKPADASTPDIYPAVTKTGIKMMSINLLLEKETTPVVYRGPIIANTVEQFWTDVVWGDIDVMFIDMPPGTGDVPLSVFQSIPLDGIVIATSPQELVSMIVGKAVIMAQYMDIPILGIVENMSYIECPDCGKKIEVFGESRVEALAEEYDIPNTAKIPFDRSLAAACDRGVVELFEGTWLDDMLDIVMK